MQNLSSKGLSFETLKETINNFEWKRGVTNCSSLSFLVAVHAIYVVLLTLIQKYAVKQHSPIQP